MEIFASMTTNNKLGTSKKVRDTNIRDTNIRDTNIRDIRKADETVQALVHTSLVSRKGVSGNFKVLRVNVSETLCTKLSKATKYNRRSLDMHTTTKKVYYFDKGYALFREDKYVTGCLHPIYESLLPPGKYTFYQEGSVYYFKGYLS